MTGGRPARLVALLVLGGGVALGWLLFRAPGPGEA